MGLLEDMAARAKEKQKTEKQPAKVAAPMQGKAVKPKRGRPPKNGKAMSDVERNRAYRARKKGPSNGN